MLRSHAPGFPFWTLAFVAFAAHAAHAGITYQSQSRFISANANEIGGANVSQSAFAPDFLLFDRTLSVSAGFGRGTGQQTSTLTAAGISATGYWVGAGHVLPPSAGGGGRSGLQVDFDVDQSTPFMLTTRGLTDFQSTFAFHSTSGGPLNLTVAPSSLSGVLPPGSYSISAMVIGSGGNANSSFGEFSLQLQLQTPTPGAAAMVVPVAFTSMSRRRRSFE